MVAILDSSGKPFSDPRVAILERELAMTKRFALRAKHDASQAINGRYDAASDSSFYEKHWANADNLDPHTVAALNVRRKLRSRSRYEVIENNPYLKGCILTLANDFVGTGPKLQITDKRIPKAQRQRIEQRWQAWSRKVKFRQKLWRMRVAKLVDGETFLRAFYNTRLRDNMALDLQVIECDRITSNTVHPPQNEYFEIDGVKFDEYEQPIAYYVLRYHPGGSFLVLPPKNVVKSGDWTDARYMVHWFRQDRGWLRGLPELAPSLPLCSILRRYTLAVVHHAEIAADLTLLLETEGPGNAQVWTDSSGKLLQDDPFQSFPVDKGMMVLTPWGYKAKQLEAVPMGQQYDEFVGSLLREIVRPIHVPYNFASGSSKDSNMASAVVDTHIYKSGQQSERTHCNEEVCDPVFDLFWQEASLIPGYFDTESTHEPAPYRRTMRQLGRQPQEVPDHEWQWPAVGLTHTDPQKVAAAIDMQLKNKTMTMQDIQWAYFNRDFDDWQEQVESEAPVLKQFEPEPTPTAQGKPSSSASKKPSPKKVSARNGYSRNGLNGRSNGRH